MRTAIFSDISPEQLIRISFTLKIFFIQFNSQSFVRNVRHDAELIMYLFLKRSLIALPVR